jgi:hypothetical protein
MRRARHRQQKHEDEKRATPLKKHGDAKMTDKLIERAAVKIWGDELFSVVLTDDEFNALTADQLREALTAYSCQIVVRRADGTFTMIDYSGCDGEQFDVRIVNHPDGSFTVKEYRRSKEQTN